MFRLVSVFQEVPKYLRPCISFYALQQVSATATSLKSCIMPLGRLNSCAAMAQGACGPRAVAKYLGKEGKKDEEQFLDEQFLKAAVILLTLWWELWPTGERAIYVGLWKKEVTKATEKNVPCSFCILLNNTLWCFSTNSYEHPPTHTFVSYIPKQVALGQLIKQWNAQLFFQSTWIRIMKYCILEKRL